MTYTEAKELCPDNGAIYRDCYTKQIASGTAYRLHAKVRSVPLDNRVPKSDQSNIVDGVETIDDWMVWEPV